MQASTIRKAAVLTYVIGALLMLAALYVGLVYHGDVDTGADAVTTLDFVYWVVLFSVLMGLLVVWQAFLLVAGKRPRGAENLVAVECKNCSTAYDVVDTGERPLYYACPQCGAEDVLETPPEPLTEVAPEAAPAAAANPGAAEQALLVRCRNCSEVFDLPYTEKRPVYGNCPKCGRRGVLPAPAAEGGVPVLDLEGIGPTFAQKLAEIGIQNSEQLRQADMEAVASLTDIPRGNLESWRAMADLIRIKGIGPQYAEVLARTGIETVQDLARQNPKALAQRVQDYLSGLGTNVLGTGVDEARTRAWVRAAKQLKE